MTNAYTKVPSAQLLDDCPRILAASQRFSSWLHDMEFDDYFDDYSSVDRMDNEVYVFLRTLNDIGKRPAPSKLIAYAPELFDAAQELAGSVAVLDAYMEDHPNLPQDAYRADRDAFLQSLARYDCTVHFASVPQAR